MGVQLGILLEHHVEADPQLGRIVADVPIIHTFHDPDRMRDPQLLSVYSPPARVVAWVLLRTRRNPAQQTPPLKCG